MVAGRVIGSFLRLGNGDGDGDGEGASFLRLHALQTALRLHW